MSKTTSTMEVFTLCLLLLRILVLAALVGARAPRPQTESLLKEVLSKALGIQPSKVPADGEAPSYMKRLYRAITTREGVVTAAPPYRASRVTALQPLQDPPGSTEVFPGLVTYNVNRELLDDVQGAELHVHVPDTRSRHHLTQGHSCKRHRHHHRHGAEGRNNFWRRDFVHHGRTPFVANTEEDSSPVQIRVWAHLPDGKKFFLSEGETTSGSWHAVPLETRRLVEVLESASAVDTRAEDSSSTFHLPLVIEAVDFPQLELKPLLVFFNGHIQVPLLQVSSEWVYKSVEEDDDDVYDVVTPPSKRERRQRRYAEYTPDDNSTTEGCIRLNMEVEFNVIGWSDWIISPSNYNAFHCKGTCDYPMEQRQRPSNHATVQSIVAYMGLVKDVEQPNCGPSELESLALLYYERDNIVYRAYEGMIATSCGCI
ncbi:uncharacterized protein LOC143038774 [Oratosquilla oratoria]|uniref:uncharacterized protein LOC143038774 n=1 Tax=Oratosquilla oratoria TaxID=337810 RepID=UPI003F76FB8B